jgi:hypothetical protein
MSHRLVEPLRLNDDPPPPLPGAGPWLLGPPWLDRLGEVGWLGLSSGTIAVIVESFFHSGRRQGTWSLIYFGGSLLQLASMLLVLIWLSLIGWFAFRRRRQRNRRGFEVIAAKSHP